MQEQVVHGKELLVETLTGSEAFDCLNGNGLGVGPFGTLQR
jgi:hypothetical protein